MQGYKKVITTNFVTKYAQSLKKPPYYGSIFLSIVYPIVLDYRLITIVKESRLIHEWVDRDHSSS